MIERYGRAALHAGGISLLMLLGACGGGGGRGPNDPMPTPPTLGNVGVPEFTADSAVFDETAGTVGIKVTRFGARTGAIRAQFLVLTDAPNTASDGADFVIAQREVVFAEGDSTPQDIVLGIVNDAGDEPAETLTLQLLTTGGETRNGVTRNSRATTTITINDNDPAAAASTRFAAKQVLFTTNANPEATFYRVMRGVDGVFKQIGKDFPASVTEVAAEIAVHLAAPRPQFRLDACTQDLCSPSPQATTLDLAASILATGYIKSADTTAAAEFGAATAVSDDGTTIAIGAPGASNGAGAVYVYRKPADGSSALSAVPVKLTPPSNQAMRFGASLALNGDGSVLAVGAPEDSNSRRNEGEYPAVPDEGAPASGGVFVYQASAGTWMQPPAYFKAPLSTQQDRYGSALSMAPDALTLVVGVPGNDTQAMDSGAIAVLSRSAPDQPFSSGLPLKPASPEAGAGFGAAVAISADRGLGNAGGVFINTQFLLVGAPGTTAAGTDGTTLDAAGAGYLFIETRQGGFFGRPNHIIRPPRAAAGDRFGTAVAISRRGGTLVIGAPGEDVVDSGAIFVYQTAGFVSGQPQVPAFIRAKYPRPNAGYGAALAVSDDGESIAVGAAGDSGSQAGVDDVDPRTVGIAQAGAVDVLLRGRLPDWSTFTSPSSGPQPDKIYVKAANPDAGDRFGTAAALSNDGTTLVVGAPGEDGSSVNFDSTGGNPRDDSQSNAGAAYLY